MAQTLVGHVFMSYSRKDEKVMRRVTTFLREQGINVWVDNERLVPGTPIWEEEIERAIKGASAIVVILSPDAKSSEWVRREITYADQYHRRIFPLLARGDEDSSITLRLITRQYIDIREQEYAGMKSLSTALSFYFEELEVQAKKEREEAEKLAQAEAEREAAEREAARLKLEREAAELAAREALDKAAREEAERKNAERAVLDAEEQAEREKLERQAAEQASRMAAENAAREKAIRETAELEIARLKEEREYLTKRTRPPIMRYFLYGVLMILILAVIGWWIVFFAPRYIPASLVTISASNAEKISEIHRWNNFLYSRVNRIAFSPDGQLLASASSDNKIRLWKVANGIVVTTISALLGSADEIVFSPDGQSLASNGGYHDQFSRNTLLWRVSDGELIYAIEHPTESIFPWVMSIAFSPDGQMIAFGSGNGPIRLYRASDGSLIRTLEGHSGFVESLAFSPDGHILASASWDESIRLWRVSDGELRQTLQGDFGDIGDFGNVNSVAFSPDGEKLASGHWANDDKELRLWRVSDGTLILKFDSRSRCITESVAFSPDGTLLASASHCAVRLWRVSDGTLLKTLEEKGKPVRTIAFSPDGKILAYASDDGTIRLWGIEP